MATSTGPASPPPSWYPWSRHHVNSPPIFASGIQCQHHHWHEKFCYCPHLLCDLTHRVWLDFTHNVWLDLTRYFRLHNTRNFFLDLTHSFGLDLTLFFKDSIRLTYNESIFNLSHNIRVTSQSGFKESHLGQCVFEIIQHWNCGIFHNFENWNCFWRYHS